jgi:DNA-binding CsgD family transcriptional regulator
VKWTAAELGTPLSTVYALRQRALAKLGVKSVADLVGLVRAMPEAVVTRFTCGAETLVAIGIASIWADRLASLTAAERAIIPLLLRAKRHTEIACERGTSPQTVANQISSIYHKFRVSDPVELALRLARR